MRLVYYALLAALVLEVSLCLSASANQESKRERKLRRSKGQPKIKRTIRMRETAEAPAQPSLPGSDTNNMDLSNVGPTNQLEMNPDISVQLPQSMQEPSSVASPVASSLEAPEYPAQQAQSGLPTLNVNQEQKLSQRKEVAGPEKQPASPEAAQPMYYPQQQPQPQPQPQQQQMHLLGRDSRIAQHQEGARIENRVEGSTNNISLNVEGAKNEQSSTRSNNNTSNSNGPQEQHHHTCRHPHEQHSHAEHHDCKHPDHHKHCDHPSHRAADSHPRHPAPQINININGDLGKEPSSAASRQMPEQAPEQVSRSRFIVPVLNDAHLAQAVMSGQGIEQALARYGETASRQPAQFMLVQPAPSGGYIAQPVALLSPYAGMGPFMGAMAHQMAPAAMLHPANLMSRPHPAALMPMMMNQMLMRGPAFNGHPALPGQWMLKPKLEGSKGKKNRKNRKGKRKNKNSKERDELKDEEEDEDEEEATTTTKPDEPATTTTTTEAPQASELLPELVRDQQERLRALESMMVSSVPASTEAPSERREPDEEEEIIWKTVQVPERRSKKRGGRRKAKKEKQAEE